MGKKSILDVAKRIKENKLLKEKEEKEEKEKVRRDIKNTPYIKNCYFIGMLIKRYIKTTAYYSINIEALIDIDKIFLKGYPKEKVMNLKYCLLKKHLVSIQIKIKRGLIHTNVKYLFVIIKVIMILG